MAQAVDRPVLRAAIRRFPWPRGRSTALLFHHLADEESSLTAGLGVTMRPGEFADRLQYGLRHHCFVTLDDFLAPAGRGSRRPLLVTFDDAYASVRAVAAPICRSLGVPAVFFVNADFVDNTELALDNLIAHVVNTQGLTPISRAAGQRFSTPHDALRGYVPTLTPRQRGDFSQRVAAQAGVDPKDLVARERPYVTGQDLADLGAYGFEIGNHTASHVHCRVLDAESAEEEVVDHGRRLEGLVGRPVRAFAFPYGHRADATPTVVAALRRSGYRAGFVVHGLHHRPGGDPYRRPRVSLGGLPGRDHFTELEVLPRLRALRTAPDLQGLLHRRRPS